MFGSDDHNLFNNLIDRKILKAYSGSLNNSRKIEERHEVIYDPKKAHHEFHSFIESLSSCSKFDCHMLKGFLFTIPSNLKRALKLHEPEELSSFINFALPKIIACFCYVFLKFQSELRTNERYMKIFITLMNDFMSFVIKFNDSSNEKYRGYLLNTKELSNLFFKYYIEGKPENSTRYQFLHVLMHYGLKKKYSSKFIHRYFF